MTLISIDREDAPMPKLPAYQAVQQVGGCRCKDPSPCKLDDHVIEFAGRVWPNWPHRLCLSCLCSVIPPKEAA